MQNINQHIVAGKPAADYHADEGALPAGVVAPTFSASFISDMLATSPAEAIYKRLNDEIDHSAAPLRIGSAAHALVLRDDMASLDVIDAEDWKTKAAKEGRDAALRDGRIPVNQKELREQVEPLRAAFSASAVAQHVRRPGAEIEASIYWQEAGIFLRARPDLLPTLEDLKSGIGQIDYKTEARINDFESLYLRERSGLIRIAHYTKAVFAAYGIWPNYWLLVQSKDPPHRVQLVMFPFGNILRAQIDMSPEGKQRGYIDFMGHQATHENTPDYPAGVDENHYFGANPSCPGAYLFHLLLSAMSIHTQAVHVIADSLAQGAWAKKPEMVYASTDERILKRAEDNMRGAYRNSQGILVPFGYQLDQNNQVASIPGIAREEHRILAPAPEAAPEPAPEPPAPISTPDSPEAGAGEPTQAKAPPEPIVTAEEAVITAQSEVTAAPTAAKETKKKEKGSTNATASATATATADAGGFVAPSADLGDL